MDVLKIKIISSGPVLSRNICLWFQYYLAVYLYQKNSDPGFPFALEALRSTEQDKIAIEKKKFFCQISSAFIRSHVLIFS